MYFWCPKIDSWFKNVISGHFRFISGEISAEKMCFRTFYSTKRFVFEFQGEALELFLSYLAHFDRYHHFRGFWQLVP